MRSIFSAILTILYIGYGITAFIFAWDAVSYFSGVHSFFGLTLIWFLIIPVLLMIPFAPAAMICALIYYLAAIRGWGYLLAIIYCFPSIGLVILSMICGGGWARSQAGFQKSISGSENRQSVPPHCVE